MDSFDFLKDKCVSESSCNPGPYEGYLICSKKKEDLLNPVMKTAIQKRYGKATFYNFTSLGLFYSIKISVVQDHFLWQKSDLENDLEFPFKIT